MIVAVFSLALGFILGIAYFVLLRANTQLFAASGSWRKAALLYAVRLTLTAAALWLIAQAGAASLLASLAGFLVARSIMLSRLVFRHG